MPPQPTASTVVFTVKTQRTTYQRVKKIAHGLGFSSNSIMYAFLLQLILEKRLDVPLEKDYAYPQDIIEKLDQENERLKRKVINGRITTYTNSKTLRKDSLKD